MYIGYLFLLFFIRVAELMTLYLGMFRKMKAKRVCVCVVVKTTAVFLYGNTTPVICFLFLLDSFRVHL